MNNDMNEKKTELLNRYGNLFSERTGYSGPMLDGYVEALIRNGEQYYGDNFVEDIIKEKRNDSIIWLMDEIARHAVNQPVQPTQPVPPVQPTQSVPPVQPTDMTPTPMLPEANEPVASLPPAGVNADEMNLKEEWVHYLMGSNMTEKQARDYAADPNNNWNYQEWLKQRQLTETPQLPPASEYVLPEPSTPNEAVTLTMEDKKQLLLSYHDDEIKKRIFGSRILGELNPIQISELDSGLEEIIKNGELHYGEDFVNNFAKLTSKDEIDKILRSLPIHPALEAEESTVASEQGPSINSETTIPTINDQINDINTSENENSIINEQNNQPNDMGMDLNEEPIMNNEVTQELPVTARKGKRKEAPQSLFSKLKEKWKNASFKKKLLIVALGAAVAGLAVAGIVAAVSSGDSSQINQAADVINNTDVSTLVGADPNLSSATSQPLTYDLQAGDTIYSNAEAAANGVDGLAANEFIQGSEPQALYHTDTNTWEFPTQEQMHDQTFMDNAMADGQTQILVGDNPGAIGDSNGFINAEGYNEYVKGGK